MKRIFALGAVAVMALSIGGCAVHAGPHDPYRHGHYRVIQGPTIYPTPYHQRPWTHADRQAWQEQQRWNRWYSCQRHYGNRGSCAY